jgi:hypothetical protein
MGRAGDGLSSSPMSIRNSTEQDNPLNLEEVRLVSDLRIMHSKVDELHHVVDNLKRRHSHQDIFQYADVPVLAEDIRRVDEIYRWFVKLKEEAERQGHNVGKLASFL